jgi:YVTN family beta-propeller protein
MRLRFILVALLSLVGVFPTVAQTTPTPQTLDHILLVTNARARHVSFVDPAQGVIETIEVGAAPWGIALGTNDQAYVSTAEGIAVLDVRERKRLALVPYVSKIRADQFGEYQQGGMGIAASPNGAFVYVAVYLGNRDSVVEVLDTKSLQIVALVPVGVRPFDVVMSRDGKQVISIDHDSYSVTLIDAASLKPKRISVVPLGDGAFDKPHYAVVAADGKLWLPYQGRALVQFDPAQATFTTQPLTANTHQHGLAFTPDGRSLLIVGTVPAGSVDGAPSLTVFDTQTGRETILPLPRPHERVAVSPDGRQAYLTGGYLLNGGWDGLTIVDLQTRKMRELNVPDSPQDIVILNASAKTK